MVGLVLGARNTMSECIPVKLKKGVELNLFRDDRKVYYKVEYDVMDHLAGYHRAHPLEIGDVEDIEEDSNLKSIEMLRDSIGPMLSHYAEEFQGAPPSLVKWLQDANRLGIYDGETSGNMDDLLSNWIYKDVPEVKLRKEISQSLINAIDIIFEAYEGQDMDIPSGISEWLESRPLTEVYLGRTRGHFNAIISEWFDRIKINEIK